MACSKNDPDAKTHAGLWARPSQISYTDLSLALLEGWASTCRQEAETGTPMPEQRVSLPNALQSASATLGLLTCLSCRRQEPERATKEGQATKSFDDGEKSKPPEKEKVHA